jgi:hypothetical protein
MRLTTISPRPRRPSRGKGLAGHNLVRFLGAPRGIGEPFVGESLEGACTALRCNDQSVQLKAPAVDLGIVETACYFGDQFPGISLFGRSIPRCWSQFGYYSTRTCAEPHEFVSDHRQLSMPSGGSRKSCVSAFRLAAGGDPFDLEGGSCSTAIDLLEELNRRLPDAVDLLIIFGIRSS